MRVFVLLFNAGTENEGIHTIRENGRNKILMFESEDDATRFALQLEAQDFPSPSVEEIEDQEIKEFCQGAGYEYELIPANDESLVLPPELNVEDTDWQIEDKEKQTNTDKFSNNTESPEEQKMSDAELDSIRRRLEGLL